MIFDCVAVFVGSITESASEEIDDDATAFSKIRFDRSSHERGSPR
jgi:hypothetical protein